MSNILTADKMTKRNSKERRKQFIYGIMARPTTSFDANEFGFKQCKLLNWKLTLQYTGIGGVFSSIIGLHNYQLCT